MTFGKLLNAQRKISKLSAEELAKLCGVSESSITLMESGKSLPEKEIIPKLALVLGVKTNIVVNWYLEDLRENSSSPKRSNPPVA